MIPEIPAPSDARAAATHIQNFLDFNLSMLFTPFDIHKFYQTATNNLSGKERIDASCECIMRHPGNSADYKLYDRVNDCY
jgi:hypothetical protein